MIEDFHAILGVPPNASQGSIRHAYLELVKTCHPDLYPDDPEAAEKFKRIHRAFEGLYKPWLWTRKPVAISPESLLRKTRSRSQPGWQIRRVAQLAMGTVIGLLVLGLVRIFVLGLPTGLRSKIADNQETAVAKAHKSTDENRAAVEITMFRGKVVIGNEGRVTGVDLSSTLLDDAAFRRLEEMSQLQSLSLQNTNLTDMRLPCLAGLSKLQTLNLQSTPITDAGLNCLEALTNLQTLSLQSTRVTDAGLSRLRRLTNLRELNLKGTQIAYFGLVYLKDLSRLQTLNLQGTKVNDAGLKPLKRLTQLKSLDLRSTKVTDAGVKDLREALPNCTVTFWIPITEEDYTLHLPNLDNIDAIGKDTTVEFARGR